MSVFDVPGHAYRLGYNMILQQTARIRAKPWMFQLPFKVLWSSNNIKKLNVIKENEKKKNFSKIFFFLMKIIPPDAI